MENLFILAAVAGSTEFLKRLWANDKKGAITIAFAVAIGALAGAFRVEGLNDPFAGIVIGLTAVGVFATIDRARRKS